MELNSKELYLLDDVLNKIYMESNISTQIYDYASNHLSMVEIAAK